MNWKFWQDQEDDLDPVMEKILNELKIYDPDSDEFALSLSHLERLTELKADTRKKMKVSPDTLALVLGNLAGILLIVAYEQKHVMTSKGLNYVKPKT